MRRTRSKWRHWQAAARLTCLAAWAGAALALAYGSDVHADATRAQMGGLLPDEPCLSARFMPIMPGVVAHPLRGEMPRDRPLKDRISLHRNIASRSTGGAGTYSEAVRGFCSRDRVYFVSLAAEVFETTAAARQELRPVELAAAFPSGSLRSRISVGDESAVDKPARPLLFSRLGRVIVRVRATITPVGHDQGVREPFPPDAVEALAHMMLLRAARQPELTGAEASAVAVTVDGRTVGGGGLNVAGVVYVPVLPYARAAAWSARWDARSGALALQKTGRPALALRALSAAVNGGEPALKVPLLSDRGQPVMGLSDLVALLGGAAARDGSVVRVRL